MAEIRRKVLASKTFTNPNQQEDKKPATIPNPHQHQQQFKPDTSVRPDSDNERSGSDDDVDDDDEFDNIIEATPVTDRIGLAKLEKERSQATRTTRTFSSNAVGAPYKS
jgi:pre-rRNA-processing protein TSR3